jgi:hypothetical protein
MHAEIPAAVEQLRKGLKSHTAAVLSGGAPASLLQPAPASQPMAQPAPVTMQVFAVKNLSWTDANGELQTCHRWLDIELPVETAKKALAIGAAVGADHELRRKHKGTGTLTPFGFPSPNPCPESCVGLDSSAPPDAKPVQPIIESAPVKSPAPNDVQPLQPAVLHSAFEKPTIGSPQKFTVARNKI